MDNGHAKYEYNSIQPIDSPKKKKKKMGTKGAQAFKILIQIEPNERHRERDGERTRKKKDRPENEFNSYCKRTKQDRNISGLATQSRERDEGQCLADCII